MKTEIKQQTGLTLESVLFVAVSWGAAWTIGFLLGFG